MLLLYAFLQQYDFIGAPQIKLVAPISFFQQNFAGMGRKLFFKFLRHVLADFIASLADGWADGTEHVFWAGMEFLPHCREGLCPHAPCRAPPSRMGQADGTVFGVQEIQRHAVCVKGGKHQPGLVGNQPVHIGIATLPGKPFPCILPANPPHIGGMGLVGKYKIPVFCAKGQGNPAEIFFHRLPVVPSGKA